jgi:hypothetical protein
MKLETVFHTATVRGWKNILTKHPLLHLVSISLLGTTAIGCTSTTDTAMSETTVYHAPEAGAPAPLLVAGPLVVTILTTTSEYSSSFAAIDGRRELQGPAFP